MTVNLQSGKMNASANLGKGFDLSISIRKQGNVNCYFLDDPLFSYFESPQFSGNLAAGGSVNCEKISLYPHASGTHTECALHVFDADFDMRHIAVPSLQFCSLISVEPESIGNDRVITMDSISRLNNENGIEALIVRTMPNGTDKLSKNYSDSNPPYFEPDVLTHLKQLGFKHILTDLPSIDKESDEGRLAAHKNWFLTDGKASRDRTITELIYVENSIVDGIYLLSMQIPSMQTDAVPSRIIIYPCV